MFDPDQAGGAARLRMASRSFTRLPFLEHFVDVPVPQITDGLLKEADAAVRGSGDGGGEGGGGRVAALLQTQHDGEYADTALKTVAARRLWRLGGAAWEADFSAPGLELITQMMSSCKSVSVSETVAACL